MEKGKSKANKKPFYKRVWFIGLCVIVVIGIFSNIGNKDNNAVPPTNDGTVAQTPVAETKTPLVVTTDKIIADLEANALSAANTYKGKYVELTGKLSNIDSSGSYFNLSPIKNDFSFVSAMCNIGDEHLDAVSKFAKDQKVTVVGTITDVGEVLGYTLDVEKIK